MFQSFYFKLRSMIPCCLCQLNFAVAVPEEELIQVRGFGPALICDTANKTELMSQMKKFLISTTVPLPVCLPGCCDSSCHDVWQRPGSGKASRQVHHQRSVWLKEIIYAFGKISTDPKSEAHYYIHHSFAQFLDMWLQLQLCSNVGNHIFDSTEVLLY